MTQLAHVLRQCDISRPPPLTPSSLRPVKQGADPTAREQESGLCAVDVGDWHPGVLQQMQEKGEFQPPPAVEGLPRVSRVDSTSLQVQPLFLFVGSVTGC